jgi:hypothetical protein
VGTEFLDTSLNLTFPENFEHRLGREAMGYQVSALVDRVEEGASLRTP